MVNNIVYCGITDGVYDSKKQTIQIISKRNYSKVKNNIIHSASIDSTGGMLHKVEEALSMARKGVDSVIINGNIKNNLYNLLQGKEYLGTLITS